mgnify:CR=1 FL=1
MSKLGEMIRKVGIDEVKRCDKKKIVTEDRINTIAALAEYELNTMTANLAEAFTGEEQKKIDINELQIIVCQVMIKMCKKLIALKKDEAEFNKLSIENDAELDGSVKSLLTSMFGEENYQSLLSDAASGMSLDGLKAKVAEIIKAKKGNGLPAIPGAPVFGPNDDSLLN